MKRPSPALLPLDTRRRNRARNTTMLTALCLALCTAFSAAQEREVILQEGRSIDGKTYSDQDDTWLNSKRNNVNNGASGALQAGYNGKGKWIARTLIRFGGLERALPAGAVVESAVLELYSGHPPAQQTECRVQAYVVKGGNAGWREGTSESDIENGTSAWRSRSVDADFHGGRIRWLGGPGLGKPGEGYEASPAATATAPDKEAWIRFSGLEGIVQNWVDNPQLNAGLLLRVADESKQAGLFTAFPSAEHKQRSRRPKLTIRYRLEGNDQPAH